jgi:PKD repeat protein
MRVSIAVTVAGVTASLLVSAPSAGASAAAPAAAAAVDTVTAMYEMNEPSGATVMNDSSGNGNNGVINPAGVQTGVTVDGATGYSWTKRPPAEPPVEAERVISVADDAALEPGDQDFTVEIRYRTAEPYGNVIQKGQALATGGQWKVQLPQGRPSCLFQGTVPDPNPLPTEDYQIAARTPDRIDDNQWHVLRCEFSFIETTGDPTSRVDLYVDGVFKARKNGLTGPIDNHAPMTVGGKLNCDQITITCDYYTGQVDYVKLSKTLDNLPPVAVMPVPSCTLLACSFSSAGSSDPDGSIASYAWTFGDGATSSSANPSHTYAAPGVYTVKLIVTDNGGAKDSATRSLNVASGVVPSKPRQATASARDRSAVVSWLKPSLPGDNPVSGYVVTSSPDGRKCTTTTALTCTVSGLRNEQPYTFTVVASSASGVGPPSDPTTAVTPIGKPLAPGTVSAKPGNHQVTVSWSAANGNGSPVTSYVITKSTGGPAKVVSPTVRSVTFTNLLNGHHYRFSVAATNVHGTGAAKTSATVTPAGRPGRPTHVTAKARTKAALVAWHQAASGGAKVKRYTIMSSTGDRIFVRGDVHRVRFPGLKSGKKYAFKVAATNRVGRGPWSDWSRKIRIH